MRFFARRCRRSAWHLMPGFPLETAIIVSYLKLLAQHPDSLIARKYGLGTRR